MRCQPLELEFVASAPFGVCCAASGTGTLSHVTGTRGIRLSVFTQLQQPPRSLWGSPFWVLPFGVSRCGCLRLMFNPTPRFCFRKDLRSHHSASRRLCQPGGFGGCWCFSGARGFLSWGHLSRAGGTETSALISHGAAHPEIRRFKVQWWGKNKPKATQRPQQGCGGG